MIVANVGWQWSRRELASCAIVCRCWANVLRPWLFRHMCIGSHSVMATLLDLCGSPVCRIAQYQTGFRFAHGLDDTPFIHLAHRAIQTPTPHNDLTISGPLPRGKGRTLRSIYGCIPKSLPRSCAYPFVKLILSEVHFRSMTHLVRLVRELPLLEQFSGFQLTWSSELTWPEELLTTVTRQLKSGSRAHFQGLLLHCTPHHRASVLLSAGRPGMHAALGGPLQLVDDQLPEVQSLEMVSHGSGFYSQYLICNAISKLLISGTSHPQTCNGQAPTSSMAR